MKTTLVFNHKFKKGDKVFVKVSQQKEPLKCTTCTRTFEDYVSRENVIMEVKITKVSFGNYYKGKKRVAYDIGKPLYVYNIDEKYLNSTAAAAKTTYNIWMI